MKNAPQVCFVDDKLAFELALSGKGSVDDAGLREEWLDNLEKRHAFLVKLLTICTSNS